MPSLERLSRKLGGSGFTVVAVSIDEDGDSVVAAFARDLGLTFDILHEQTGAMKGTYHVTGVPERWMISHDGVIIKKMICASRWDCLVHVHNVHRRSDECTRSGCA